MNKIFINECSLQGQYDTLEEFINRNADFVKCLNWLYKHNTTWKIYKKNNLYHSQVTKDHKFYDLRQIKIQTEKNTKDILRKMKSLLLKLQEEPPFWNDEAVTQDGTYYWNDEDISGTSIAEAAAQRAKMLSFYHPSYCDVLMSVKHETEEVTVSSISTYQWFVKELYDCKQIEPDVFLKLYFAGTRLNFSKLEAGYGLEGFEKSEIKDCMKTFERFVNHSTWADIYKDSALVYKDYSPSAKENWFRDSEFRDKKIDKFRCINPKRCFGYKEGDTFYALRIERDHSISDNG